MKRRIKRDYKPAPPRSLSSPTYSSAAQGSVFYNDAKWSSMWYIVSVLHIRESLFAFACLQQYNEIKQMSHMLTMITGHFEACVHLRGLSTAVCPHLLRLQVKGHWSLWRDPDRCRFSEGFVRLCGGGGCCIFGPYFGFKRGRLGPKKIVHFAVLQNLSTEICSGVCVCACVHLCMC